MSPQNGVPAVNGSRIASQQQLMQARQQLNQPLLTQQQQQLAQAIAQVQAQTQTQTTNGNNVNGAANMSPPPTFSVAGVPRDASSSPAQNSVGTPSVTPRPPSAQAIQPTNGAAPIPASSQRAYYMPNVNMSNYSAEQMAQLRNIQLSMLVCSIILAKQYQLTTCPLLAAAAAAATATSFQFSYTSSEWSLHATSSYLIHYLVTYSRFLVIICLLLYHFEHFGTPCDL